MLGGVGYSNCGATFTVGSEVCWYSNCGVTFTVCAEVWGIEIVEPLLLHARRCGVLKLRSHFYCMHGCGVLKLWSHFYCILGVVGYWKCGVTFNVCSGVGYWNCGATFTACSEVWGIQIVEPLLLYARRCGVLKLWSHFYCLLGGVGYWNCGATFTVCSEVLGIEIVEPLLLSCNNVAPVTNLCLGRATTRSNSSQWSKQKVAVET
jgi:multisubunit Na+/H+ antiporter MnhG subunit